MNNNTTHNNSFDNHGTITNSGGMVGNLNGGQTINNSPQSQTTSSPPVEMTDKTLQFDVCIICALSEEASAVINEFTDRCNGIQFKRAFSKVTKYEYKHAVIKNSDDEELTVLIIWMPFTGPTTTVNSVRSLLAEFHPRFVAMTGICAGDEKKGQVR